MNVLLDWVVDELVKGEPVVLTRKEYEEIHTVLFGETPMTPLTIDEQSRLKRIIKHVMNGDSHMLEDEDWDLIHEILGEE